jgi:DNA polymerase III epsilon subunit-like protein
MRTLPSKTAAYDELIGDRTFLVIDIETTEVADTQDGKYAPLRPISLACVVAKNGTVRDEHHWLVNPGIPVDEASSDYNGLTDANLVGADDPAGVIDKLVAVIDAHPGAPLVAQNAGFDIGALRDEAERVGALFTTRWVYDTSTLGSRVGVDEVATKANLKDLCERYGVRLAKRARTHKAAVDALATVEVFYWLLAEAAERGHSSWSEFQEFIHPDDTLTIAASYPRRWRRPTAPVIAGTHFHEAHSVRLPAAPTKTDLDDWMAHATECVNLRCPVLPEKVKAETAHTDVLLPRLSELLASCASPGEVGTLLAGLEPLLTLLDKGQARTWYKKHHQSIKARPAVPAWSHVRRVSQSSHAHRM